nr:beta-ketoacyl synthase N-terminal-like domain-containing protein [uncultured Chitinophaga sp.]
MSNNQQYTGLEIAITGMACRFPGARNWREFWHNLTHGVESVNFLSEEELRLAGVPEKTIAHKNFVNAVAGISDKDRFDAAFFGYRPVEARFLNPLHRIFHECVWEAIEDAACDPERVKGPIGVFAGAGDDSNWKLYSRLENRRHEIDDISLNTFNNKDYLASLLAYRLNLKGPAFTVNTTCSTSLVAVSLACKSLLLGETRIALAGGISLRTYSEHGYFHEEGMIVSADGHCKPFDKDASGTVSGEGCGVVVLKRLKDALEDGDHIYCIIKGSAINNDGNRKVGFTATSVEGQLDCIRKAQKFAMADPATITFIEAHGTGTRLGDPIEIEALNIAFKGRERNTCAIGSVKSNIGHLDAAAGIAGLMKAALSLKYRQIPASLHFKEPNPEIDFSAGPFYVNTALKDWQRSGDTPLRAGVSSFGIGGTNVHVVLEEGPAVAPPAAPHDYKLLTLSAKTSGALNRSISSLADFIDNEKEVDLTAAAYTLQTGRKQFPYRKTLVYQHREDLLPLLKSSAGTVQHSKCTERNDAVVFMFPGQGSQYCNMVKGLYTQQSLFRKEMDRGFEALLLLTGEDFKNILFSPQEAVDKINETRYAQPLIFLVEYSLARLLLLLGITPCVMIGHSIGEYTAACISGLFSFEDALKLVVKRGALMNSLPGGSMLSVALSHEAVMPYLDNHVSLAAVNAPEQVVLSGETAAMTALKVRLDAAQVAYVPLHTSHAFHSSMQEPILAAFLETVQEVTFGEMKLPFVSNVTGKRITAAEATSPAYWVRHLRDTVNFSAGIQSILTEQPQPVFIEAGAGRSLCSLLKQQRAARGFPLVRPVKENEPDSSYFLQQLGAIWSAGISVNWELLYKDERRKRISLPAYSFEPSRFPAEVNLFNGAFQHVLPASGPEETQAHERPLPAPLQERPEMSVPFAAASTVTEIKLKNIFEGFFGMDNIGVEDNFFELGGDSLKGMLLLKRIKQEFDVSLSVKDFFDKKTIRQMAAYIEEISSLLQTKSTNASKSVII